MRGFIFDTETTGLLLPSVADLQKQPRIIELGVLIVEKGVIVSEANWLMNPGCFLDEEIKKITGLTDSDLADKPSFGEISKELLSLTKGCDYAVAHNAPFDVGMLDNEFKRLGDFVFPWPETIVCSVQEYAPFFGKRMKLTTLYEQVLGRVLSQTHRALDDAKALYEILAHDNFFESI